LQQLENKVAIITGGSSGIGRTIALAFAREGAAVIVNYVGDDPDEAEDVVKQIEDAGGKAVAVRADVTSQEDVEDLVRKTVEEFGRLDIMVNNAGVEDQMPFLETPLDVWNKVIAVNLTGAWLGCQVAAGRMVEVQATPPATAAWATGHAAVRTRPRADRKIGATLATTVR